MLTPINEPKYAVQGDKFVNRVSGEDIPENEPVFLLRGRDVHAAQAIIDYAERCEDPEHKEIVLECARNFLDFKDNNPERMKEPDTARNNDNV